MNDTSRVTVPVEPEVRVYSEADKARCRRIVREACRTGQLVRPDRCSSCGKMDEGAAFGRTMIQGHHNDYSRPLDVEWLCPACHRLVTPMPWGGGGTSPGETNGQAKLTEDAVRHIRSSTAPGPELARKFGVNRKTIQRVRSGLRWSHVQ